MATESGDTYVMDLAVLLKALRDTQQSAAQVTQQLQATQQAAGQVGQQLQQRLRAVRDLDGQTATALTQAVQQATATLQQEQARMIAQSSAELRGQHKVLCQQWQEQSP